MSVYSNEISTMFNYQRSLDWEALEVDIDDYEYKILKHLNNILLLKKNLQTFVHKHE